MFDSDEKKTKPGETVELCCSGQCSVTPCCVVSSWSTVIGNVLNLENVVRPHLEQAGELGEGLISSGGAPDRERRAGRWLVHTFSWSGVSSMNLLNSFSRVWHSPTPNN